MLNHKNLAADLMVSPTVLKVNTWDIFFSVLPLHHTYECTCGFLMPLYKGAAIGYCQGLKYIVKNLQEVRPTMFLGVPAIFTGVPDVLEFSHGEKSFICTKITIEPYGRIFVSRARKNW